MAAKNKFAHLSLNDRSLIQEGINFNKSKADIARDIGADPTTVAKEIRAHRAPKVLKTDYPIQCARFPKCKMKNSEQCSPSKCLEFEAFKCKRRDRSPGACNNCSSWSKCHYLKFTYLAGAANDDYQKTLVDCRLGVDMTTSEAMEKGALIKQLLDQGQSPYEIVSNHPELNMCEKTLYNYIESDVFRCAQVSVMDLRRQVSRKPSKHSKPLAFKKRKDYSYLKGRKREDMELYIADMQENGVHVSVVEMDTMYNDVTNGPFIQTFKIIDAEIALAVYHTEKTADAMVRGLDFIEEMLGRELFESLFTILKPDRGTEFTNAQGLEFRKDGTQRTHVFYCDPMASWQKPHVENKHIEYRFILPNKEDLFALGLRSQEDLNLVLSHLNSRTLKSLGVGNQTPFQFARFYYSELVEKMYAAGIEEIPSDHVILEPYLLNKEKREEAIAKINSLLQNGKSRKN